MNNFYRNLIYKVRPEKGQDFQILSKYNFNKGICFKEGVCHVIMKANCFTTNSFFPSFYLMFNLGLVTLWRARCSITNSFPFVIQFCIRLMGLVTLWKAKCFITNSFTLLEFVLSWKLSRYEKRNCFITNSFPFDSWVTIFVSIYGNFLLFILSSNSDSRVDSP